MRSIWKFFTSLRLTVACLAIGLVLVFFGTLAQVDEGLWNAQTRWFRSFFIWWGPSGSALHIPIFPGGYLLGCVLLLNLLAAHAKRFNWSVRKIGIQLTHLGIVLLLAGQLITDRMAEESMLSLHVGQTKSYSEASRQNELVFASDAANGQEEVVSIPQEMVASRKEIAAPQLPFTLRVKSFEPNGLVMARDAVVEAANKLTTALATVEAEYAMPEGLVAQAERANGTPGRQEVWQHALEAVGESNTKDLVAAAKRVTADRPKAEKLCLELKKRFRTEMLSRFSQSGGAMHLAADRLSHNETVTADSLTPASSNGDGKEAVIFPMPESKDMDNRNLPYAVLELDHEGQSMGTWVVTPMLEPQEITVGAKTYRMAMRFQRIYHPFSTTLLKTTHDVYTGTVTAENPEGIPKNFQSRVRINNPQSGETREVDIYMNNPLRYAGLTFYQYQMGKEDIARGRDTSTLQVVRNPGWITPYVGVIMVGLGMLYQFLFHLVGFIGKRKAPATVEETPRKGGKRARPRETASAR